MKIKFLGTAAAEGFPGLFCSCEICEKARKAGGKNIRTRSQSLINDDLLIDFSADTYFHTLNYGLDLRKVKSLIITHGHDDHLYPFDLGYRASPVYAEFPNGGKDKKPLEIYLTCRSDSFLRMAFRAKGNKIKDKTALNINYIKKFVPFTTAGYSVTPLKADHAIQYDPVFYIISKDGKTVLYGHDTGYFPKASWDYIEKNNIHFDFVTLDCTCTIEDEAYSYHMGFKACCDVKKRLLQNGNADKNTIFYLNHFSHNCGYTYDELCPIAEKEGFCVSYDGLEVEF